MKLRTPTKRFPSSKGICDLPEYQAWEQETKANETNSFYNRNTSHSNECFPPTDHKAFFFYFFFIKASTTLVSHRIAEAKLVNHLSRVRQYNMVSSAL